MRLLKEPWLWLCFLLIGCSGGKGHDADMGYDASAGDAWSGEGLSTAGVDDGRMAGTGGRGGGTDGAAGVRGDGMAGADGLDSGGTDGTGDLSGQGDSAGQDDAGGDGGTPSDPCDPAAIIALALTGEGTVTVTGMFDGASSLKPQTPGCTAGDTGPEVVYSLDVPPGVFHLVASTVSQATTADTVVYLQTACGAGKELACNDDTGASGPSAVLTSVTGPLRLYIVVDSFNANPQPPANAFSLTITLTTPTHGSAACTPVQPGELDPCAQGFLCPPSAGLAATCTSATAPVIDSAELFPQLGQPDTETTLFLSAHDAQGDWKNLRLAFKNTTGTVLGSDDQDMTDFWGQAAIREMPFLLSVPVGTASLDATLTDSMSLTSATVNAVLTPWADLGQSCNSTLTAPDPCLNDLVCVNAVCATSGEALAACAQAASIEFNTPVSGTAADLAHDTFEGSCPYEPGGNDKVFRAVLPALAGNAVAWDLVASTANPTVPFSYYAHLDSYLYIRSNCVDPATELACADDIADTDLRSEVAATSLAPGTYYVYLDTSSAIQNATALTYTLLVRGRPVLPSEDTCDPNGIENRCQTGTCSALTGRCP